jgi:hypothetical protein
LAEQFHWLINNRDVLSVIASRGQEYVAEACSSQKVGSLLSEFIFPSQEVNLRDTR